MSRWLNDEHLVRGGQATNWKSQYKLRHNWSRGSASITETEVAEHPSIPPLLVRLHDEVVIVADAENGLRAWALKGEDRHIATADLHPDHNNRHGSPTSMAIDMTLSSPNQMNISIGFTDGSFSIYTLHRVKKTFTHRYSHAPSSNGTVSAIAYSSPYLLTMTQEPRLSLYSFDQEIDSNELTVFGAPRLLSSLKSHTAYPPLSLALRIVASHITASIAYAMPSWLSRWSVGLQELRIALDGTTLDSRLASAAPRREATPSNWTESGVKQQYGSGYTDPLSQTTPEVLATPSSMPTALSYNHPYLLTSHPDNTLTLYVVTSTADGLEIGPGNRLWGHTSSVSGAYIGDRGKAVSVSTKGNELRVWELEGRRTLYDTRRRVNHEHVSVQVHPDEGTHENENRAWDVLSKRDEVSKGWIAFDEEKVVLLREKMHGAQAVVVYDFT